VPGASYLSILLAIAESHWPGRAVELRDIQFVQALVFEAPSEHRTLHVQLTPLAGEDAGFSAVLSTRARGEAWTGHVTRALAPLASTAPLARDTFEPPAEARDAAALAALDAALRSVHIEWGEKWWWLKQLAAEEHAALGRFEIPEEGP